MTSPHHMTFCYEPWAVRRFRIVSAKSAPAPYETPPHSGGWPVSVSRRRCRSTRSAVRRRQGQPDPVGGIPSSGSPCRVLCRFLLPGSLQDLSELIDAGGWACQVPFQGTAELPNLEGKANSKDRPGHQDPFGVVHHDLSPPGCPWLTVGSLKRLGGQEPPAGRHIRVLMDGEIN